MDILISAQQIIRQANFVLLQKEWQEKLGREFGHVFLAYGTQTDVEYFCVHEDWYKFRDKGLFVLVGGKITSGQNGREGLLLVTGLEPKELFFNTSLLKKVLHQCKRYAEKINAKSIGLAGMLPSFVQRKIQKRELDLQNDFGSLFVKGLMGSTWLVCNSVLELVEPRTKVAVVGVGYLGEFVADVLERRNYKVTRWDTKNTTNNLDDLRQCELIIGLTPNGDDLFGYAELMKGSNVRKVLFDTHPVPSQRTVDVLNLANIKVFKAIARSNGVETRPALPNFDKKDMPGCMVDGYVRSSKIGDNTGGVSYDCFDQAASQLGIQTPLLELTPELELV